MSDELSTIEELESELRARIDQDKAFVHDAAQLAAFSLMLMETAALRIKNAALRARCEELRTALCGLLGIDGSPESLDRMRTGIVLTADIAPDDEAAEAAMRCVEVLARTPADALADVKRALLSKINAAAEADMLAGNPVEGAHHRAIDTELRALDIHGAKEPPRAADPAQEVKP